MSDLSYDDIYSGLTSSSAPAPRTGTEQMPWPVTAKPHKRQTAVSADDIIYAGSTAPPKPVKAPKSVSAPTPTSSTPPFPFEGFRTGNAAVDAYLKANEDFSRGTKQGVYDVLESPATKLLNLPAQTIATPIAQDIASLYGGHAETPEEGHQDYLAARNAFDASDPGVAANVGRVGGQAVASIPFMAGGNELTALGLKGLEGVAPAAANFLRGAPGANALVRSLARATQGAAAGAATTPLTSAASDQSIGEQALENAIAGATIATGVPAAIGAGRAVARGARNALLPFTEAGRNILAERGATNIVNQFTGGQPITLNAGEIVPGSKPTLAETADHVGLSRLQRAVSDANPQTAQVFATRQAENDAARQALAATVSGTPEQVERKIKARDAAAAIARGNIFSAAQPISTTPVTAKIDAILNGPSGNRPDIKQAMAAVQGMMTRDGKAITDPETLYKSVRDGINNLISSKDLDKSYGRSAAAQLIEVRDALDGAIETGAPGFKSYLSNYSMASSPIDAMKFLQSLNFTDIKGNMTLGQVQRALDRLDDQLAASGINKAKATTLAQRRALESIRDDLLRAQNISKGQGVNSITVQKLLDQQRLGFVARNIGPAAPRAIGALVGGAIGHQFGTTEASSLGALGGEELGGMIGRRLPDVNALVRSKTQNKLEDLLLNPSQNTHLLTGGGTGATQLFPNGLPPHVVPFSVIAKNRLLGRHNQ